ncbi:nucleoside triphosphate pyrophosphatase [Maricurvus nonylphenolicus]|uniref:Maf family protein n=1 Tax=Maricurvus nonylphenolicus TaxID=1008307 RepID=UPI0036F21CB6
MPSIILASSSKYRRQLLEKLEVSFSSAAPDIDESALPDETAQALVERLALAKANALSNTYPNHLIIGSDQVADLNGRILTKPGNHEAALEQLLSCQGQKVTFHTGLCLLNSETGKHQLKNVTTDVIFRELSAEQLDNYLRREQPYDCAGSFKCEGLGITLFSEIRSTDPDALIGLPLIELTSMLINEGAHPLN